MASSKPQHTKEMESLMCSLCLDVFEEATLLKCGHTFCRRCLERYDECHSQQPEQESLSMLCPLCRQETELGVEGVAGLPSNVSLNHLVEEFNDSSNPLRKLYDDRRKCSQCSLKPRGQEKEAENHESYAVVFCCDCDMYLCERCLGAHKLFEFTTFKGHRTVSMKDMMSGSVGSSVVSQFDKCSEHISEAREFYCADCHAVICHKCTIVEHNVRDHRIVKRVEVERGMREKITGLVTRCENEKDSLEAFIREAEQERRSAKASLQEVIQKIDRTFADLQRQLEERKETLKAEVEAIDTSCDQKWDSIKKAALKISSQVTTAQDILESREGHSCLEGDALVSHEHLTKELEELLETSQNWIRESQGIPGNVKRTAASVAFHDKPMNIARMGRVTADKKWSLINEVELPYDESMNGLAILSPESILIGYHTHPADELSLDGLKTPGKLDLNTGLLDLTVLSDGRFAVVPKNRCLKLFDADGKRTLTNFKIPETTLVMALDSDGTDQIYVAYWEEKLIQVFRPDGGDHIREINVSSTPQQVHTTNCGNLVIQSPDGVRVLDESGKEITHIKGVDSVLYPAVDQYDNLYIAEIHESKSTVTIKRYTLDGVLVETILDDVKIKIYKRGWYYMKCPSPDGIVLCTAGMMYVLKNAIGFDL